MNRITYHSRFTQIIINFKICCEQNEPICVMNPVALLDNKEN